MGDYVLVSYPERPPNKLSPRWRGPLAVVEVDGNTYHCQDLASLKVIPFHISRLKLFDASRCPDPTALASVDKDEWVVETILDHRGPQSGRPKTKLEFKVRWKGFEPEDDSWLPYSEVRDLEALDVYSSHHPELRL